MAKFYGPVGYAITGETDPVNHPGVFTDEIITRNVYGEFKGLKSSNESTENLNDDIKINGEISFIGDEFALAHFAHIKFVKYLGVTWKVTSITPKPPRLILTLGGVYNGE